MAVNNELDRMLMEVVMASFKIQSGHFTGGTLENHGILKSG
jgi:hypothetical protein